VTVSPLKLLHSWREQKEARRTHVLAERILTLMRRRQADARTELFFSTELLTKFAGAEPAEVFRALRQLALAQGDAEGIRETRGSSGRSDFSPPQ
jgi:hypothetical protein